MPPEIDDPDFDDAAERSASDTLDVLAETTGKNAVHPRRADTEARLRETWERTVSRSTLARASAEGHAQVERPPFILPFSAKLALLAAALAAVGALVYFLSG